MARFLGGPLRLNERAADDIFSGWISPSPYEPLDNVEKNFKFFRVKRTTWWQQKWVKPLGISVEQIGDFCNPVQNFYWVIQSYPNSVDLSKYLIQDVLSPKKTLWLSILQWWMQFGYPYLIRLTFFEIHSDPDPVLNCRIRLDRDPETGSCSTPAWHCFADAAFSSKFAFPTCAEHSVRRDRQRWARQRWALYWTWIGLDPGYSKFCWIWIGSGLQISSEFRNWTGFGLS